MFTKPKRGRKVLSTLVAIGLIIITEQTAMAAMNSGSVPSDTKTQTYTTSPGDTLWSIAERYDKRDDTRAVCDWIQSHNGLHDGQALQVGMTLTVPVGR